MSTRDMSLSGLFVASLIASGACGSEPDPAEAQGSLGQVVAALTAAQCDYPPFWDNQGRVKICHYDTKLKKKKFQIQKVTPTECRTHITAHLAGFADFVAYDDNNCRGEGCLPIAAPCDLTVLCCESTIIVTRMRPVARAFLSINARRAATTRIRARTMLVWPEFANTRRTPRHAPTTIHAPTATYARQARAPPERRAPRARARRGRRAAARACRSSDPRP